MMYGAICVAKNYPVSPQNRVIMYKTRQRYPKGSFTPRAGLTHRQTRQPPRASDWWGASHRAPNKFLTVKIATLGSSLKYSSALWLYLFIYFIINFVHNRYNNNNN